MKYNQKFNFCRRIFSRNFFTLVDEYTVQNSLIDFKSSTAKHICKIEARQKFMSIRRDFYACPEANEKFYFIWSFNVPTNTRYIFAQNDTLLLGKMTHSRVPTGSKQASVCPETRHSTPYYPVQPSCPLYTRLLAIRRPLVP